MKKAIIYARVSTTRQADDGVSIDAQIEQCHKKAKELGAVVVQVFRDDGITGTSASKRHAFQRAISFCAYNTIDYFIVWSTSRFARNKIDAASYKKILRDAGTRLIYTSMSIDQETDEGWFTDSLMEIMDEHYSRQISRDTKRAMVKNAQDGYFNGGRAPFGYQAVADGKRRRLVPNESEKLLMLEIFRRFVSGEGTVSIARSLNKSGYTNRGRDFQAASLSNILKNPVYIGQTIYNKTTKRQANPPEDWIVRQTHEGIIPKDLFDAVQRRFSPRELPAGSPTSNFYFSGLLRCGCCGRAMIIENATGRNKTYNYYNCSGFKKGFKCRSRRIPAEKLDAYLLETVINKLLTQDMTKEVVSEAYRLHVEKNSERTERIQLIKGELKELRMRREALIRILETTGATDVVSIVMRIGQYDSREQSLLTELEKACIKPEYPVIEQPEIDCAMEQLKGIILSTTDVKILRTLLRSFISSIDFNDNDIAINYLPSEIINNETIHSTKGWHPV